MTTFSSLTTARKGLGTNVGTGNHRQGVSNDVEAKEELAKEEKGKGNRAFQEKRFEDAIKHFSMCIKLNEARVAHFILVIYLLTSVCSCRAQLLQVEPQQGRCISQIDPRHTRL